MRKPTLPAIDAQAAAEAQHESIAELEVRLARLEGRTDAMAAYQARALPSWVTPAASAGGSILTGSVAIVGFWIVHGLSVRRQRRDEIFKRLQDCISRIEKAATAAAEAWKQPGAQVVASGVASAVQAEVTGVTDRLSLLQEEEPAFALDDELAELREATLLDIEDPHRAADPVRADRALRAAGTLARRLEEAFKIKYGRPAAWPFKLQASKRSAIPGCRSA